MSNDSKHFQYLEDVNISNIAYFCEMDFYAKIVENGLSIKKKLDFVYFESLVNIEHFCPEIKIFTVT